MPKCTVYNPVAGNGDGVTAVAEPVWTPEGLFKTEGEIRQAVAAMVSEITVEMDLAGVIVIQNGGYAVYELVAAALKDQVSALPTTALCRIREYGDKLDFVWRDHDAHFSSVVPWSVIRAMFTREGCVLAIDDVSFTRKTLRCLAHGIKCRAGSDMLKRVIVLSLVNRWGVQEVVETGIPEENFKCVWDIPVSPKHVVHVSHPVYHPHPGYGETCVSIDRC